jgi:Ohr subfamily peroxiredoxin
LNSKLDGTNSERSTLRPKLEILMSIQPLFTATATATGGRNGHTRATDGTVDVNLSVPKEMGGPGKLGTTTPEQLFAAGYAACFGGALDFVAKNHKKSASGASVTAAVTIGKRDAGGFGLAVKLTVADRTLPQQDLELFAKEAHEQICPYSHATRGNVDVTFDIQGA